MRKERVCVNPPGPEEEGFRLRMDPLLASEATNFYGSPQKQETEIQRLRVTRENDQSKTINWALL